MADEGHRREWLETQVKQQPSSSSPGPLVDVCLLTTVLVGIVMAVMLRTAASLTFQAWCPTVPLAGVEECQTPLEKVSLPGEQGSESRSLYQYQECLHLTIVYLINIKYDLIPSKSVYSRISGTELLYRAEFPVATGGSET